MGTEPRILDCTLRDGSYCIDFQFTADDTALLVSALDSAGIDCIEIGHGLGLGAARAGQGDQAASDEDYIAAAVGAARRAEVGAFFIPGIGTEDDLRRAADGGLRFIRIGTNITEFDRQRPFIDLAKQLGLSVSANLMKSYAVSPEEFAAIGRDAESAGADVLCIVDSAGGMLPEDVRAYVEASKAACGLTIGFHGHDNLAMGVANAIAAFEAGAGIIDASLKGLGRSEGNTVTEVFAAILQRRGMLKGVNVNALLDIGEAFVAPLLHEPRRSALGITLGRAKFHSSFLARVMSAATRHGVDVRDLILRLCEVDTVNAPPELVERIASDIAGEGPKAKVRIDIAATPAAAPEGFAGQVVARARELREKARKRGLDSVFNIVVTPYEMTAVSPYVETRYGCAMSNIMLAEPSRLDGVLRAVDGLVDYVLLDAGDAPPPEEALMKSALLTYLDHQMWARATVSHLTFLLGGLLHGKRIALTGVPPLAARAAFALADAGAEVALDSALAAEAEALQRLAPRIAVRPFAEAVTDADAVVSLSPRRPAVGPAVVQRMRPGALLYDGGIGSLERGAVPAAEALGLRVVRVDMRPSLAATALERIQMRRLVANDMGRAVWNGVPVVAGGLIGKEGDVIVDAIAAPTRVIGLADGRGGILRPEPNDPAAAAVRQAIAEKQLAGNHE